MTGSLFFGCSRSPERQTRTLAEGLSGFAENGDTTIPISGQRVVMGPRPR